MGTQRNERLQQEPNRRDDHAVSTIGSHWSKAPQQMHISCPSKLDFSFPVQSVSILAGTQADDVFVYKRCALAVVKLPSSLGSIAESTVTVVSLRSTYYVCHAYLIIQERAALKERCGQCRKLKS